MIPLKTIFNLTNVENSKVSQFMMLITTSKTEGKLLKMEDRRLEATNTR